MGRRKPDDLRTQIEKLLVEEAEDNPRDFSIVSSKSDGPPRGLDAEHTPGDLPDVPMDFGALGFPNAQSDLAPEENTKPNPDETGVSLIERHPQLSKQHKDSQHKAGTVSKPTLPETNVVPAASANTAPTRKVIEISEVRSATIAAEPTQQMPANRTRPTLTESIGQRSAVTLNPMTSLKLDQQGAWSAPLTGAYRAPNGDLMQSEHLRLAQERILELEDLVTRFRVENEQLSAAAEALRNRSDELVARTENIENSYKERFSALNDEKIVLDSQIRARNKEKQDLQIKVEELEMRLSTDMKRVRVRERELENRLELVRIEGQAVLRSKDEMLLELKRKIDQLGQELENYRSKSKDLNRRHEVQQDRIRRTVKALRLALSMLEGDESDSDRKPEGS
jgi:hypothetical protein